MEAKHSRDNQSRYVTRLEWAVFILILLYALVGLPALFMAAIGEFTLLGERWIAFFLTAAIGLVLNISILVARIFVPRKKISRRRGKQPVPAGIKAVSRQI